MPDTNVTTPRVICSMAGVTKRHEKKVVLENIHLSYFYGAKIGVLGLNGSGKSTLLRILAGEDHDFEGRVTFAAGYTVGHLPQEPTLTPGSRVGDVVAEGLAAMQTLLDEFERIGVAFADVTDDDDMNRLLERQGVVQAKIDAADAWDLDAKAEQAIGALGCPPADVLVDALSGGERRRVALARLLLSHPDVLLLDEPTNHLDADAVGWLEQHLARFPGTVIAVTHDRYFLDNVAGWILELDRGRGHPFQGNYTAWLEQKSARLAVEERQESARKKAITRELEWVRASPSARRAKSKARLAAYETMVAEQARKKADELDIFIPPGPRLGDVVIQADDLAKRYDGRTLFEGLSFKLPPNGIVGVVGPNGAGKTTLFRLITGQELPDAGTIRLGPAVQIAYVEQSRDVLGDDLTVWQAISGGEERMKFGHAEVNSRAYVARFGFLGTDQQKPVSVLSGGERNRVHLARTLTRGANVILLDEPTNDLDVNVIRALEDALLNFAGCCVVVSHDRYFLDRLATHTLAFEGDGTVTWFEGNYSAYAEYRQQRLGDAPFAVKRAKYRKIRRG